MSSSFAPRCQVD